MNLNVAYTNMRVKQAQTKGLVMGSNFCAFGPVVSN